MSDPEEPELHLVRDEKPRPRLLHDALSHAEPAAVAPKPLVQRRPVAVSIFIFLATAMVAALLTAGAEYLFRHEIMAQRPPVSVLKSIRQALPTPPRPPLEVPAEALHVTAITLGNPALAVVNGRTLAEGDWLEVRSDAGVAALHVLKIGDGVVQFGYGGHVIEARFESVQPPAP